MGERLNKQTPPRVDFGARSVFVQVRKLRLAGIRIDEIGNAAKRRDGFFFGGVLTTCVAGGVRAEVAVIAEVVHLHPSQGDRDGDGKDRTGRQGAGKHAGIHRRDATVDRPAIDGDTQSFANDIRVAFCQREVDIALCRITSADAALQQRLERGRFDRRLGGSRFFCRFFRGGFGGGGVLVYRLSGIVICADDGFKGGWVITT